MPKPRTSPPNYGLDAPPIVYGHAALGAVGMVLLIISALTSVPELLDWGIWTAVGGCNVAGLMIYSSKVGKIRMRDRLFETLRLRGDEDVLDLGCGSGLMLLGAAQRLTTGTATGVDLWRRIDQAGSSREQCLDNARRLAVSDRVELVDADMTDLPFPDSSFDLVCACLAIHNLHPRPRRERAVREAVRVLRPGGRLVIVDIAGTKTYMTTARALGLSNVQRSSYLLGIFPPARTVTGSAPTAVTSQQGEQVTDPPTYR